ncbi:MAG TPA: peptidylprolyl isomerase, partial [Rhodocyclaceae bacterium]|nr:peptidylprolyl isomerase [Rhodocyclaceae bacterium]
MNRRLSHAVFASLLAASLSGAALAKEPAKDTPPAVAKVNGMAIPQARFDEALRLAIAQGNPDTPELRTNIRSQLIAREVFRQEAVKHGWQNDPQVLEARDAAMVQRYLKDAVRPAPVGEEAVRARYDSIVAGLGEKEYRYRVLAVADEAKAKAILAQLRDGKADGKADFAVLARDNSLLPSRDQGGEMDWVSFKLPAQEGHTQTLPLPIAQALAALPAGGISAEPIAWQGLWYLIRAEEERPT